MDKSNKNKGISANNLEYNARYVK